jgi:hypothetical protein
MNPIDCIKKNIVTELTSQGASVVTAQQAAEYAAGQYRTTSTLGKDPYSELLRLAGAMAMKNQSGFRYVQPKPKVSRGFRG